MEAVYAYETCEVTWMEAVYAHETCEMTWMEAVYAHETCEVTWMEAVYAHETCEVTWDGKIYHRHLQFVFLYSILSTSAKFSVERNALGDVNEANDRLFSLKTFKCN